MKAVTVKEKWCLYKKSGALTGAEISHTLLFVWKSMLFQLMVNRLH